MLMQFSSIRFKKFKEWNQYYKKRQKLCLSGIFSYLNHIHLNTDEMDKSKAPLKLIRECDL